MNLDPLKWTEWDPLSHELHMERFGRPDKGRVAKLKIMWRQPPKVYSEIEYTQIFLRI